MLYVSFRFDLMYGVTESEKFHILPPVALLHGVLDGQRDEILRDHAKVNLLVCRVRLSQYEAILVQFIFFPSYWIYLEISFSFLWLQISSIFTFSTPEIAAFLFFCYGAN